MRAPGQLVQGSQIPPTTSPPNLAQALLILPIALVLTFAGLVVDWDTSGNAARTFVLACVAIIIGSLVSFIVDGGRSITTLGFFCLPFGAFTGGAGLLGFSAGEVVESASVYLMLASLFSLAGILLFCVSPVGSRAVQHTTVPFNRLHIGIAIFMLGSLLSPFNDKQLGPLPRSLTLAGFTLIGASLAARPTRATSSWVLPVVAVLGGILVYLKLFFGGDGRLQVVSIAVVALAAFNLYQPSHLQKSLVIVAIPIFLVWASVVGNERHAVSNAKRSTSLETGLASVYSPFFTASKILRNDLEGIDPRFPRQYGRTFLESSVTWVPRTIWSGKPVGLGTRLTQVYEPKLLRTGHSMAALAQGEFYINFGVFGLALFLISSVVLVRRVDRLRTADTATSESISYWILGVASFGDYIWVGTFTVMARTGLSLFILFIVFTGERIIRTNGA